MIVFDLDGTIANDDHRVHIWSGGNFDECFSLQHLDTPNIDVCWLLDVFNEIGERVIIVTARPERFRKQTVEWLDKHCLFGTMDVLLMRPDTDRTPSDKLKIRLLEEHFGSKANVLHNVKFALEDRDKVVNAFREYGLNCWQVRQGKY